MPRKLSKCLPGEAGTLQLLFVLIFSSTTALFLQFCHLIDFLSVVTVFSLLFTFFSFYVL